MTLAALISNLQRRLAVKLDVWCLLHLAANDNNFFFFSLEVRREDSIR